MLLLALERRAEIARRIEEQGSVRVSRLSRDLGVTEETIRRDLEALEKEGVLKRTHGGAVHPRGISYESPHHGRHDLNRAEKEAIARAVAGLIGDGETVLLDASSTALYVARALQGKQALTILTNSLAIVNELKGEERFTVFCTGGALRRRSLSFVGPHAERALADYHVDRAVISCRGLDLEKGFTDSNELEVELKKRMIEAANEVIAAVDSSKWGYIGFARIGPVQAAQRIVTDKGADPEEVERLRELGIEVIVAEASPDDAL